MSLWSNAQTLANQNHLAAFGDTFQATPTGAAAPVTFTAVRGQRNPLDNEQLATYERIWTRYSQLPSVPDSGWVITDGQAEYSVYLATPDPEDPTGDSVIIYLNSPQAR